MWESFLNENRSYLEGICIGRTAYANSDGTAGWEYGKMSAYCLRLYSRALSEEEVTKNYEKSIEYHSLPENE